MCPRSIAGVHSGRFRATLLLRTTRMCSWLPGRVGDWRLTYKHTNNLRYLTVATLGRQRPGTVSWILHDYMSNQMLTTCLVQRFSWVFTTQRKKERKTLMGNVTNSTKNERCGGLTNQNKNQTQIVTNAHKFGANCTILDSWPEAIGSRLRLSVDWVLELFRSGPNSNRRRTTYIQWFHHGGF